MKNEILDDVVVDHEKVRKMIDEFKKNNGRDPTLHEELLICHQCEVE